MFCSEFSPRKAHSSTLHFVILPRDVHTISSVAMVPNFLFLFACLLVFSSPEKTKAAQVIMEIEHPGIQRTTVDVVTYGEPVYSR